MSKIKDRIIKVISDSLQEEVVINSIEISIPNYESLIKDIPETHYRNKTEKSIVLLSAYGQVLVMKGNFY